MNFHLGHNHGDNDADPFTTQLRAQPLRPLPDAWREEILSAALASRDTLLSGDPSMNHRTFAAVVLQWLWPHPAAYAALLAVWALILGLRFVTPGLGSDQSPGIQLAQAKGSASSEPSSLYAGLRRHRNLLSLTDTEEGRP